MGERHTMGNDIQWVMVYNGGRHTIWEDIHHNKEHIDGYLTTVSTFPHSTMGEETYWLPSWIQCYHICISKAINISILAYPLKPNDTRFINDEKFTRILLKRQSR